MFGGRMPGKRRKAIGTNKRLGFGQTDTMGIRVSITGGTVLENEFIDRIVWVKLMPDREMAQICHGVRDRLGRDECLPPILRSVLINSLL
jgi:hypothetical protein